MHQTQFHSLNSRLLLPPRFNRISPSSSSSRTQSPWINPSNFNARHFVINRRTWEARSLRKEVKAQTAMSHNSLNASFDSNIFSQGLQAVVATNIVSGRRFLDMTLLKCVESITKSIQTIFPFVLQNVAASSLPFACVSYSAPPVDNSVISQALIQLKDKHVRVSIVEGMLILYVLVDVLKFLIWLSCKLGKMFVGCWKKLQHAKDNAVADREQDSSNERNQTGSSLDFYKGYDDVVSNWINDYTNTMESNAKLKLELYVHKKNLCRSIITFLFTYVLAAIIIF